MSTFFNDTMTGLLQAVAIEKGEIPVDEVKGMPAKTYRNSECTGMHVDDHNELNAVSQASKQTVVIS